MRTWMGLVFAILLAAPMARPAGVSSVSLDGDWHFLADPGGTVDVPNLLIGEENNWHGFDIGYIVSKHTTLVGGFGIFGNLANTTANDAWYLQLKYEF